MTAEKNAEQACWPNRLQELLLRATILDADSALDAWRKWADEADFENLDLGSHRLLPETYTRLSSFGVDHPYMARMKGLKRRTWLENQLLFRHAETALGVLDDRQISTMVTKGPALVLCHYKNHGRRPMADFDIVVHRDRAEEAVAALSSNGFQIMEQDWPGGIVGLQHAVGFHNQTGRQFDLHWHVIGGCTENAPFWDNAVSVSVNDTATLAPSATDLLLHVCVHGVKPNDVPPLRWVVDASVILNNPETEIDWSRLVGLATRLRYGHRMEAAFEYLRRFDLDGPADATAGLWRRDFLALEKLEFERVTRTRRKSVTTQFAATWLGFHRFTSGKSGFRRMLEWPDYLKSQWSVRSVWKLPGAAFGKTIRRLLQTG